MKIIILISMTGLASEKNYQFWVELTKRRKSGISAQEEEWLREIISLSSLDIHVVQDEDPRLTIDCPILFRQLMVVGFKITDKWEKSVKEISGIAPYKIARDHWLCSVKAVDFI